MMRVGGIVAVLVLAASVDAASVQLSTTDYESLGEHLFFEGDESALYAPPGHRLNVKSDEESPVVLQIEFDDLPSAWTAASPNYTGSIAPWLINSFRVLPAEPDQSTRFALRGFDVWLKDFAQSGQTTTLDFFAGDQLVLRRDIRAGTERTSIDFGAVLNDLGSLRVEVAHGAALQIDSLRLGPSGTLTVPEPAAATLSLLGLMLCAMAARRRGIRPEDALR